LTRVTTLGPHNFEEKGITEVKTGKYEDHGHILSASMFTVELQGERQDNAHNQDVSGRVLTYGGSADLAHAS
jgi:hypothetical protein